jgi:hypothetical protein
VDGSEADKFSNDGSTERIVHASSSEATTVRYLLRLPAGYFDKSTDLDAIELIGWQSRNDRDIVAAFLEVLLQ